VINSLEWVAPVRRIVGLDSSVVVLLDAVEFGAVVFAVVSTVLFWVVLAVVFAVVFAETVELICSVWFEVLLD